MNRIRNKLLLILTLGILLPMFSAEYYSLRNARISQHTEVMNQLESILEQKNQMITALFDREKQVLEIMATRPTVVNSLLTLSHQYEQGTTSAGFINNSAKLRPIFQELGTQQSLNNVYLVTKKGHVILALNNQHDFGSNIYTGVLNQSAFATIAQKVLRNGQPTYSKFTHYLGDNNQFSAFVAAPIKLGVETIGALIVQVYPSKLDSIINDYTALNRTGETILAKLKDEKAVFISPLRFYTPGSDNVEVTFNSRTDKPVQKAVQGLSGFGDSIDYRQQETLAVWRYLPQHNLGMVVKLDKEEAFHNIEASAAVVYWIALFVGLPFIVFACWWSSRFTRPIVEMVNSTKAIAQGDLDQHIDIQSNDELGQLASAINEMSANITKTFKDSESNLWLQQGIEGLSVTMRGNQISTDLADNIVGFVSNYLNAKIGTLYIVKEHNLELAGGYAYVPNAEGQSITFGDGLVGQAAISKEVITITDVPKDYIPISSSLGKVAPSHLIIYPIMKEDVVLGVIELGWLDECHAQSFAFLDSISESVATALAVSESHQKLQTLLDQSQQQMEELQVREEELRAINDEVEQRSSQLANSQKALEQQSQKLLNTNEALKQKTASLEQQKAAIETKNTLIEQSSREIEKKADELEAASQYKSEFLANMSHELRTPLNSMLILSRILYDNDEENLDEDQVESAKVIHNSGQELLSLINDILDLSKIEAGKMDTLYESYDIRDIGNDLRGQFNAIANDKGLDFVVDIAHDIPHNIELDVQKTLQILKNLLSNAMKFTDNGAVTLKAQLVNNVADPSAKASILSISVTDSGIGISPAKQQEIFEAFQQADGSTSRKYGGTGLGLTISRHLADLIDGEIFVTSEENVGSTFSIYLPLVESDSIDEELNGQSVDVDNSIGEMAMLVEQQSTSNNLNNVPPVNAETEQENEPNRNNLEYDVSPTDKVLVIIEDDIAFAKVLSGIASKSGFKCLLADTAKKGLALVNDYLPCGVILDLGLPDMSGADALDIIKQDPRIKNIPIHIISGHDKTNEMTQKGAAAFHQKPINKQEIDNLLENLIQAPIHHHDGSIRQQVMVFEDELSVTDIDFSYLDKQPIDVVRVNTFDELSHNIGNTPYHVASIILKCRQLTPTCEAWLREHEQHARDIASQIILMLDETPTNEQAIILEKYGCQVIIHGTHSAQRLHDEIILFLSNINLGLLHSAGDTPVNGSDLSSSPLAGMLTASPTPLPIKTANEEENIPSNDLTFEDCKVLLVDDDLRNTFALSKVLKKHGMNVVLAENGKMALDKLEQNDDINIVLMDIMMPVMDGHEAMRKIRAQEKYKTLPIIALTAKAMQEDRRRCVEAGASDYLTKPVDIDKLVAMMRVWLYQELA